MNSGSVLILLEQNWPRLAQELGDQWQDFAGAYGEIVEPLPAEPTREEMERTTDALCELLARYEFGRGLLHGYQAVESERMLGTAHGKLGDKEPTSGQVCNRLKLLQKRKPGAPPKDGGKK
jgi:hypothetical protein